MVRTEFLFALSNDPELLKKNDRRIEQERIERIERIRLRSLGSLAKSAKTCLKEQMREDIEREMALYRKHPRECDLGEDDPCLTERLCDPLTNPEEALEEDSEATPSDLRYRLLFTRDNYSSYLADLNAELNAIQVL